MELPDRFKVLIITLSDRAFKGEYKDLSGPRVRELISDFFNTVNWQYDIIMSLIPDDASVLRSLISEAGNEYELIFTTGGTGIGPRDITVDTVIPMLSKQIPGIMEFIRVKYAMENPNALLSRSVAGIAGKSLIYTLPGSVKAVEEYMHEIIITLRHTIMMQYGLETHGRH